MNYQDALIVALTNKELVANYDRVSESNLGEVLNSMNRGGLNYQIDLTTGRVKEEIQKFDKFFYEFIWLPVMHYKKKAL